MKCYNMSLLFKILHSSTSINMCWHANNILTSNMHASVYIKSSNDRYVHTGVYMASSFVKIYNFQKNEVGLHYNVMGTNDKVYGCPCNTVNVLPASTTYETNKGPKWVLIWGLCGRPIWSPISFCKRFSDGTNMVYQ